MSNTHTNGIHFEYLDFFFLIHLPFFHFGCFFLDLLYFIDPYTYSGTLCSVSFNNTLCVSLVLVSVFFLLWFFITFLLFYTQTINIGVLLHRECSSRHKKIKIKERKTKHKHSYKYISKYIWYSIEKKAEDETANKKKKRSSMMLIAIKYK